jgi:hypothetical protein
MHLKLQAENIYIIGDTHTLNYVDLLIHRNLKNFILVHVGDSGEGFHTRDIDEKSIKNLNDYCKDNHGIILTVRGNHSDPDFYNNPTHWSKSYDHVVFVPDYTYIYLNNNKCLFVGGALSIDRQIRRLNIDYWTNEGFYLPDDYDCLSVCDVLFTHSAASCCPPYSLDRIKYYFENDPTLREELILERLDIQKLYEQVKCAYNFYGHFHQSSLLIADNCIHRCLDINEIYDATRDFNK